MAKPFTCPHGIPFGERRPWRTPEMGCPTCHIERVQYRQAEEDAATSLHQRDLSEPRDYSKFDGTVVSV